MQATGEPVVSQPLASMQSRRIKLPWGNQGG